MNSKQKTLIICSGALSLLSAAGFLAYKTYKKKATPKTAGDYSATNNPRSEGVEVKKPAKGITRRTGNLMICAGLIVMLAAAGLWVYNISEDQRAALEAEKNVRILLEQQEAYRIQMLAAQEAEALEQAELAEALWVEDLLSARTGAADDYEDYYDDEDSEFIGVLKIPALWLELPVFRALSDTLLKQAPCRYSGRLNKELVIAAHNYWSHFGGISTLSKGDPVTIVDMKGREHSYSVEEIVTLESTDINEMVNSEYELTLFTCTFGGAARTAVRCSLVSVSPL